MLLNTSHGKIGTNLFVDMPTKFQIELVCKETENDTADDHDAYHCNFSPFGSMVIVTKECYDQLDVLITTFKESRRLMILNDGICAHANLETYQGDQLNGILLVDL